MKLTIRNIKIIIIGLIIVSLLIALGNNQFMVTSGDSYYYTYDTIPEPAPFGLLEHIRTQTLPDLGVSAGKNILDVQPLVWHHGCSPTSYGMILWYYDLIYGTDMMNGDPYGTIASIDHYNDYCIPIDTRVNILPDCSETPLYCHVDDCIADCLLTSRSSRGLHYGGSNFPGAISLFIEQAGHNVDVNFYGDYFTESDPRYAEITYEFIKSELVQDRPVAVQIPGHISVAMAYDDSIQQIGYLTTWSDEIAWYPVLGESGEWYVKGVIFIDFGFGPAPPPPELLTCYKRIDNNLVISMETSEDVCPVGWFEEWPNGHSGDIPGFDLIMIITAITIVYLGLRSRKVKI